MTKVAIVTGASRGIGAAIAQRLAADGFAVLVNYAGRAADADKIVAAIEADGGQARRVMSAMRTRRGRCSMRRRRRSAGWMCWSTMRVS